MSSYTTQLRYYCENQTKLYGQPYYKVIPAAAPLLFDFDYPFYNPLKKAEFEQNFIKHFYMREIGVETFGYFKLILDSKFNEIMPKYNKLLQTYDEMIDPFITDDITETENAKSNTTGNSNVTTNNENINLHSSTPQGTINNLLDGKYLDDVSKDNATNSSNTQNNQNANSNMERKTKGLRGYAKAKLLAEYQDSVKSVYSEIYKECDSLFMQVF